ncbi:PIG-L family deacetylase [Nocardioides sp. BP30]|uniref:PIG-L deacetylase family protein n=1 Tax=Nocardioides sp. BP30 TaxID=3036374 RepID=UPI002468DA5D|nr:PIG-L family deacetylase [Nocardioides sp. BP30]WGL51771.1 PIG-L family deacetylase [Nocardioides sp. BP30]
MLGLQLPAGHLEVLCLGAHPDDVEIGCGGTLLCLAERDASIRVHVMTGTPERAAESTRAIGLFAPTAKISFAQLPDGRLPAYWNEVKQGLEDLAVSPGLVLAPRVDDAHQDHRLLGRLAATVWRDALVLHYEIPKWDGDLEPPTHYVSLTPEQAHRKVELLDECFPSQIGRDWWDDELFLGLMRLRGVETRARYAEAFHTTKVRVAL